MDWMAVVQLGGIVLGVTIFVYSFRSYKNKKKK